MTQDREFLWFEYFLESEVILTKLLARQKIRVADLLAILGVMHFVLVWMIVA